MEAEKSKTKQLQKKKAMGTLQRKDGRGGGNPGSVKDAGIQQPLHSLHSAKSFDVCVAAALKWFIRI